MKIISCDCLEKHAYSNQIRVSYTIYDEEGTFTIETDDSTDYEKSISHNNKYCKHCGKKIEVADE